MFPDYHCEVGSIPVGYMMAGRQEMSVLAQHYCHVCLIAGRQILIRKCQIKMLMPNHAPLPLTLQSKWESEIDDKDPFDLALKVKDHFKLTILMITQGSKGAFLIGPMNDFKSVRARQIKVKDTIGSGDSFLAGFLYQYLNDEPLIVCLERKGGDNALD